MQRRKAIRRFQKRSHGSLDNASGTKVLVIGLGQLGFPVAQYVKQRGFDTYGYDISSKALENAEGAGIKRAGSFSNFDVYILCVSTHMPNDIYLPYTDNLMAVARQISEQASDGALVCIESTIPLGTARKICDMFNHRLHVAHVPHRWYQHDPEKYGVNQLRVAGGIEPCCLAMAVQFYSGDLNGHVSSSRITGSLGIPIHPVKSAEVAELTKTVENAHRYLQIAFAEELYIWCRLNNLDFWALRDALNTKWNVNVLEPRDGIGGHCLPKDTRMFLNSSQVIKSKILSAALEVDMDYRNYKKFETQANTLKDSRIGNASIPVL
ncbi:MAG: NAD(P)-binding domain-containing protein [Thermoproteota archaeon]